jgi:DnaK suppressor protein
MTQDVREGELRQMLLDHRQTLQTDVHDHLRAGRDDHAAEGRDDMERADDNIRGDLSFALLQMKSESLTAIDLALARLAAGRYGVCIACEQPIPSRRLRALPFAVRCQPCADAHERANAGVTTPSRWGPVSDVTGGLPA